MDVSEIKSMAGKHIIKKKKQGKDKLGSAEGTKSDDVEDKAGKQKPSGGSAETSHTKQSRSKEKAQSGSGEKANVDASVGVGVSGISGLESSQPVFTAGDLTYDPYLNPVH